MSGGLMTAANVYNVIAIRWHNKKSEYTKPKINDDQRLVSPGVDQAMVMRCRMIKG